MKHSFNLSGTTSGLVAIAAASAFAASCATAQGPRASNDPATVDKTATAALETMGSYLRTLTAFGVHAVVTSEEVMQDGRKVQSQSIMDLIAEKPDAFRLEITDDLRPRTLLYDGKTFTEWSPVLNFYASIDATHTTRELADVLEDKYGLDLPFVDLFRWGTPDAHLADLTAATDLGPGTVDGVTCEQFAFRQEGLDWQVWIQEGDYPLPRKLVLTTTADDARPEYTATYTWNMAPSFSDNAFTFKPPAGAKRIQLAKVSVGRPAAKQPE